MINFSKLLLTANYEANLFAVMPLINLNWSWTIS